MSNKPDHQKIGEMISQSFKLQVNPFEEIPQEEKLFVEVQKVVQNLLDRDMAQLLNSLYRIDLAEQLVKKILVETDPDQISFEMTKAIISRVKEKLYYRNKYS